MVDAGSATIMQKMATSPGLPTGTLTFLFTDIEGSTAVLQLVGDTYAVLLADALVLGQQDRVAG